MRLDKNINDFMEGQIEDFFDDLTDSKKKVKLFSEFSSSNINYTGGDITIPPPDKKFIPKIKKLKTNTRGNNTF